jgi:5-formyltetrahydrofolate cyclo-ligase
MEADGFGVDVPAADISVVPRVLVVPMLGFDRRGHRLGYGAGHYDRTLDQLRRLHRVFAIGFAYSAQECDRVPTEPTDQPLDLIVTEAGAITPHQT